MKKITFLFSILLLSAMSLTAQNYPEPGDWPNTGDGPVLNLVDGINTVTGRLETGTAGDGQDRFQVQVPGGGMLTAANFSITRNGNPQGFMTFNSTTEGTVTFPSGSIGGTPYGSGIYTVLVAADFAVGNNWTMTFDIDLCDIAIGNVSTVAPVCPGGSDGSVTITATCGDCTALEYSLDNVTFQPSNVFASPAGDYTAYARDTVDRSCLAFSLFTVPEGTENVPPMITCPGNQTEEVDGTCMLAVADYTGLATASDNCTANPIVTQSPMPGTMIGLGNTTVTLTADDGNGQTVDCMFILTVEDNEDPEITCIASDSRSTDMGVCNYTVQGTEFDATFTDNCMNATITNDFNNNASLAGAVLPLGDTVITWTVDDGNDQMATCPTTITVADNEAPIIQTPAQPQFVQTTGNTNFHLSDTDANTLASDDFQIEAASTIADISMIFGIVSSRAFVDGTISNITATIYEDNNGAPGTQVFSTIFAYNGPVSRFSTSVTVPVNSPSLSAGVYWFSIHGSSPDGLVYFADAANQYGQMFHWINACSPSWVPYNNCFSNPVSPGINATINFNNPPLPSEFVVVLDTNGVATLTTEDLGVEPMDNCGIQTFELSQNNFDCDDISQSPIDVIVTATDINNNPTSFTVGVTIEDNEAPLITCIPNDSRDTDAGVCDYTVQGTEFDATFTDNCMSATITNDINNSASLAGAILPTGDTVVTWTVDDGNGQTAACMTTITVEDNEDPIANCVAPITIQLDDTGNATILGQAVPMTLVSGSLDATDPQFERPNASGNSCTPNSGVPNHFYDVLAFTIDAVDTYTFDMTQNTNGDFYFILYEGGFDPTVPCMNWIAGDDDTNGNDPQVSLELTLVPGNYELVTTGFFSGGAVLGAYEYTINSAAGGNVFEAGAVEGLIIDDGSSDNCDIASIVASQVDFTCADIGDNTVTLTITDVNGNESMCTTVVTVEDNTPVIISSGPVDIFTGTGPNAGDCETTVSYDPVTAGSFTIEDDNCFDTASITVAQTGGLGSGAMFPVGTTVEEYTITDSNGNETIYTFDVNITDTTLPVIDCPNDDLIVSGDDTGSFTIEDYATLVSDNCSSGDDLVITQDPAAGTVVTDPSMTEVTVTATDEAGNTTTCVFNLVVDETLGVNELSFEKGIVLYPNPTEGQVIISASRAIDVIFVYDLRGRLVKQHKVGELSSTVDMTSFESGVYLVKITSGEAQVTKRVIKE